MASVEISHHGTKRYLNDDGLPHREDGPAIIITNGAKAWYDNGVETASVDTDGWRMFRTANRTKIMMQPNGHTEIVKNGKYAWPEL